MKDRPRCEFGTEPADPRPRLAARLVLARFALVWERIWPALWPALLTAGVFVALALFDVPAMLPPWAHAALLGITVAMLIAALALGLRDLRLPSREAARRRIETASGLAHRPLAALDDTLAGGGGGASAELWRVHQVRMAEAARILRVGPPRAGLLRHDPYALRVVLTLVLLLGLVDAGADAPARLVRALNPELSFGPATTTVPLDIWVSPPQYTGLPPQFLSPLGAISVAMPAGSTVLARVHGGGVLPELIVDGVTRPMTRIDNDNYKGQITIAAGKRLAVAQGWHTLGAWPITVVPDRPPTVAFLRPPERTVLGALRLEYEAKDDYGVEKITALIRRPNQPGKIQTLDLPLPDRHLKDAQGTSFNDLTASLWSGMRVQIQLRAVDALGQSGSSEIREFVLPERIFHNPIARTIIGERKALTLHPEERAPVANALEALSAQPDLYHDDIVAFLGMRTAADRLMLDRDTDAVISVQQLMWDTAVRIEDGGFRFNRDVPRQAINSLQNALARNAPEAEIDRLMRELQQSIDRYLQALTQQAQRQNPAAAQPAIDRSWLLSSADLQRILDRVGTLARTGARYEARTMLDELQALLENLRGVRPLQMQSPAAKALGAMRELMRRQEQLLDRSVRQAHGSSHQFSNDAADQEALRRMLSAMIQRLGNAGGAIPQSLRRAGRAMRDAIAALKRGSPGQAIGPQTDAVDALQRATRVFAQQLMHAAEGHDLGNVDDAGPPYIRRDPFGRLMSEDEGGFDEGGPLRMSKTPNNYALEKAKEILDELRRRASQPDRPPVERDYIDRLLQAF